MNCPDPAAIEQWVTTRAELPPHVAECARCRKWEQRFRRPNLFDSYLDDARRDQYALPEVASPHSNSVALPPGSCLGRFTINAVINVSGRGAVLRAFDPTTQREVAIKVLRLATSAAVARFEREVQNLARANHPNVATIYEVGDRSQHPAGHAWFAMELVADAESLIEHANRRDLTTRARLQLFRDVCRAIDYLHARDVLHLDLKPGNILVDGKNVPKVIDLGIAWRVEPGADSGTHIEPAGTIPYCAPEQFDRDADVDIRADVHGLGVTLFELLGGELPFALGGAKAPAMAARLRALTPRRLRAVKPRLSADIEAIVERAIARDRDERYSTVLELLHDIDRFLHGRPVEARKGKPFYRFTCFARRRPKVMAGVVVTCLLLVSLIGSALRVSGEVGACAGQLKEAEKSGDLATYFAVLDRFPAQAAWFADEHRVDARSTDPEPEPLVVLARYHAGALGALERVHLLSNDSRSAAWRAAATLIEVEGAPTYNARLALRYLVREVRRLESDASPSPFQTGDGAPRGSLLALCTRLFLEHPANDPVMRAEAAPLVARCAEILAEPSLPLESRYFAASILSGCGGSESIHPLIRFMSEPSPREEALRIAVAALERIVIRSTLTAALLPADRTPLEQLAGHCVEQLASGRFHRDGDWPVRSALVNFACAVRSTRTTGRSQTWEEDLRRFDSIACPDPGPDPATMLKATADLDPRSYVEWPTQPEPDCSPVRWWFEYWPVAVFGGAHSVYVSGALHRSDTGTAEAVLLPFGENELLLRYRISEHSVGIGPTGGRIELDLQPAIRRYLPHEGVVAVEAVFDDTYWSGCLVTMSPRTTLVFPCRPEAFATGEHSIRIRTTPTSTTIVSIIEVKLVPAG